MASHYILDGGTGDGSAWNNAWDDLPTDFVRGDVYYVGVGSYGGHTFAQAVDGTTLITVKRATVADHGTETGWDAAYAAGHADFAGAFVFTSSYWLVDGATGGGSGSWDTGFGFHITVAGASDGIQVSYTGTANNVTVRHVEIEGPGEDATTGYGDALSVYGASNVTISYFWMHDIARCPFFLSAVDFIAEHGYVSSFKFPKAGSVHSEVASIWHFDGNVGDHTFRYCLFTDIQSTGGLVWDNSSNTDAVLRVYGCVFYKPAGATWAEANGIITGWTGGGGEEFHNCLVYNNTFINCDQATLGTAPNVHSDNVAVNNLWYNCDAPDFHCFSTHDYNAADSDLGEAHDQLISGDPVSNASALNFHLAAATDAGDATIGATYNTDPDGVTRGADGVWDRGAFDYVAGGAGAWRVTYAANGALTGTVPTDGSTYAESASVTVATNSGSLAKQSYWAFIGWNTAADGSGTSYAPGATMTMPGNDVTLYAVWRLKCALIAG